MTEDDGLQFRERLRMLTGDIADLRERLDGIVTLLAATATTPAPGAATGSWDNLSLDEATGAWQRLTAWVDWLVHSYELHEDIPACWYQHRAMLEELNALCLAWLGANSTRGAGPADRVYWHEQLERALPRLRAWNIRGCTGDAHRPATGIPAAAADHHERDAFIREDLAARTATPTAG